MAMDGIEYNKGLSKARDDYHNKVREYKDNTAQEVKHLTKTQEAALKKQRENFLDTRNKMDKDYEAQLDSMSDKSLKYLKEKQDLFGRKMEEEQSNFIRDRKDLKADFDRRLDEVNTSFKMNRDNADLRHELDNLNTKTQAKSLMQNQEHRHQHELNDLSERTRHSQEKMAENIKQTKRELIQKQNKELNEEGARFAEKDFKKDLANEATLNNVKRAMSDDFNAYKNNKENAEAVLKKSNERSLVDLSRNFEEASERNRRTQMDETAKIVDEYGRREQDMKQQFADEKNELQRTIRGFSELSNDGDGAASNMREALEAGYKSRDNSRRKQMLEMQDAFERESKDAQGKFLIALDDRKRDQRRTNEAKDREFSDYVSTSGFKHNLDKEKVITDYDERNKILASENLRQQASDRSTYKRTQTAQLKNFSDTVNRLNSDNAALLDQTRDIFNKEKKEIIENSKKKESDTANRLLRENDNKISNQAENFKDREDSLHNQIKLTEAQLNDRLQKLRDVRAQDLSFQEQKHMEMRGEDWNTMKENLRLKNIENELKIKEIQRDNRNLVQKMARGFQNKMNETVTSYEGQIRQLHADYNKRLVGKSVEMKNSQKVMKAQFDQQKAVMESQHNDEMAKVRSVHDEEITKLRNAQKTGLA